jgi:hypothetical protein
MNMNERTQLERIRELAKAKMLEVQPYAGEEMTLPHSNPRRDGFVDGERTLAAQILQVLDQEADGRAFLDEVQEEMLLGR